MTPGRLNVHLGKCLFFMPKVLGEFLMCCMDGFL